ncbi:tetraspanin-33-like isoform X1 [Argonauta hians]
MLAKYALFVNSILVLVLGCVMVAMSMVTRLQREDISLFEEIDMDPVYVVLGMGALVVFISLIGCLGALRESVWTLHFFCVCVMMIFLLEIVTIVFALTLISNIQGNITHKISKGIKQYGLSQKKDAIIDDIQQRYSCCGTKTYKDWNYNPFFNCSAHGHLTCRVPDSCCRPPINSQCGFLWTLTHSVSTPNRQIFVNGCVTVLMNIFKMNAVIIGLSMLVIALLEIVSVVLAYLTIKGIYEKNSEQPFPSSI